MKRWIPSGLRLQLKIILRFWTDLRSGQQSRIVRHSPQESLSDVRRFESRLEIVQMLKAASYAENKRTNLTISAAQIQHIVIQPGEIFSFWALVGAPIARRGYREGRALVQGQLQAVMGGGLCQLSGILYHLSLQAGLTPLERYPHSADIYTDETRFTPLGSDATVVYGYKDFRFINDLTQPLCFRLSIASDRVIAQLCTPDPIQTYHVEFRPTKIDDRTEVETLRKPIDDLVPSAQLESVNISRYR
jgi:vancomycin resistance protein VanW